MLIDLVRHAARIPSGLPVLLPIAVWVAHTVICGLKTGEIHANGMYACRRDENPFGYWLIVCVHITVVIRFLCALIALA